MIITEASSSVVDSKVLGSEIDVVHNYAFLLRSQSPLLETGVQFEVQDNSQVQLKRGNPGNVQ